MISSIYCAFCFMCICYERGLEFFFGILATAYLSFNSFILFSLLTLTLKDIQLPRESQVRGFM